MSTGVQNRAQSPAFDVFANVARHNGFVNPGAPEPTSRHQERIGAMVTPIQHSNGVKVTIAGASTRPNPASSPSTRTASVQHAQVSARGVVGRNYASKQGSGAQQNAKPIAGTANIFNVGGTGGRSAILVKAPSQGDVVHMKVRGGHMRHKDPTSHPLVGTPKKIHMGFNHVGWTKA